MLQLASIAALLQPVPFASFAGSQGRLRPTCNVQRARHGSATVSASRGSGDAAPDPPPRHRRQQRREVLLLSVAPWALLADVLQEGTDGRTIVNSILGAYGLPKMKASVGFRLFDDLSLPCSFEYPRSWVTRRNTLRPGVVISDFSTADKVSLEVLPDPPAGASLAEAAVLKLINPASEIGGDSRLELPPAKRIKTETREIDGKVYTYIAFPSETVTRSGYQVRRKNLAVAASRRGTTYVLGCSARSDQFDADKEAAFQRVVASFRLL